VVPNCTGFAEQRTEPPPLPASNDVTEDVGEAIVRGMEFPLTTSALSAQRRTRTEMERNRRLREVAMQASLLALSDEPDADRGEHALLRTEATRDGPVPPTDPVAGRTAVLLPKCYYPALFTRGVGHGANP